MRTAADMSVQGVAKYVLVLCILSQDRMLDLRSQGRWFDSLLICHQVLITWMGDCLRTSKPSRYITNIKINSTLNPSLWDR